MIDTFFWGRMVVNGQKFTSDLIIYPDGRVENSWRRTQCHVLQAGDLAPLISADPQFLVCGLGVLGRVRTDPALEADLAEHSIRLVSARTGKAVQIYNELAPLNSVAACFHLTC